MDEASVRKGQGALLRQVRLSAGFESARAAAMAAGWNDGPEPVHLIKHEAVPKCGSFEVRFSDGMHLE